MASFTGLSNELIIAIGSRIRKPAHSLNLVLLNRQTHSLIIPLLYEHIVLDLNDYPDQESSWDEHEGERWTMARLSATLDANSNLRSVIRTFELALTSTGRFEYYELDLLFRMTSLKRFRLLEGSSSSKTGLVLHALGRRVSATLESLDLSSGDYCYRYPGRGVVTSLEHFIALKHLCIRSKFCIGTMRGLLPECLQQLDMHCHDDSRSKPLIEQAGRDFCLLVDLMEEGMRSPRSLRRVTLRLFWKGRVDRSAEERVQEMADQFHVSTAKLYQKGIEMNAKVRLVRLDLLVSRCDRA